ncbi:MAG: hypothetical protein QW451_00480, partial [Candidatus Aenigmatarchaeota archaeon]
MKFNKGLAKGIAKISLIVLVVLAFAIFVLNFVLPSFADEDPTVTLYPVADSYVNEGWGGNDNYGSESYLSVESD